MAEAITNSADYAKVTGTSGNDTIYNKGKNVTISASDGNDYIYNRGVWDDEGYSHPNIAPHRASILGGAGNDTIISDGDLVTIWGGDGDDSVNTTFNGGGAGDVYVYTGGNDTVDVNVGTFATFVLNGVSVNSSVTTGEPIAGIPADAHTILNLSNGKTLTIYYERPLIVSSFDDVPKINVVHNENSFTSITGLNQEGTVDYIDNSGHKVTITGDKSNYYISNWNSSPFKVNTGTGNDTVRTDTGDRSTIFTGAGNDTVYTSTSSNLIDLGDGNDSITGIAGSNNSIDAGDGNDVIMDNGGDTATGYSKINAGAGNDSIYIWHWSVNNTIHAGSGNDKVELNTSDNRIFLEDGDDIVSISGENRNLNIGEEGDRNFVDGGAGDDNFINSGINTTINGGTGDDFISNSGENLLVTYNDGDGNDLILGFRADSTLQIGGGTGTYSASVSSNDIIVTVGEDKITLQGAASLESVNILGKLGTPEDDSTVIYDDSSAAKVTIPSGIANADASTRTIAIQITGNALDNSIVGGTGKDSLYGGAGADTLKGNAGNDKLYGQAGDDYLEGGAGDDLLSGYTGNDTLAGDAGNDTFTGGAGNDLFVYSAGNDVITDYAAGDKISLGAALKNASLNGNDAVLTVGNYTLTVKNGKDMELALIDASGNESSTVVSSSVTYDDSSAATVTIPSSIEIADASSRTKAIKITGNALDNSIVGGTGKDSLYGGAGADSIFGNAGNDKLYGQAGDDYLEGGTGDDLLSGYTGDDTLAGGAGNDTFTGGAGNDLFVYSAGNDVITDYAAGDKISLGANISNASLNGSDAVFTIGNYKLTVKDAIDTELTMIDASGKEFTTVVSDNVLYDDTDAAKVTLASYIEVADSSARTAAIKIMGNALDNIILGGAGKDSLYGGSGNDYLTGDAGNDKLYGQAGNDFLYGGAGNDLLSGYTGDDTLWGGAGNDTLTGGAGADTFIYHSGEGKDVITDFGNDDLLQIIGAFSANYDASANTLAFKVGATANALQLTNFTATTLSINGKDYRISGSKLVK